jgi:hypothetical protein
MGSVIRHGSFRVLKAASFSHLPLHFISFHSLANTHARCVWVIFFALAVSFKVKSKSVKTTSVNNPNATRFNRNAHSTPFRFIPAAFTQQPSVHPLPLLCSPALSFGLRAVMLFAS